MIKELIRKRMQLEKMINRSSMRNMIAYSRDIRNQRQMAIQAAQTLGKYYSSLYSNVIWEITKNRLDLINSMSVFPESGWYLSRDVINELNDENFIVETANNWKNTCVQEDFNKRAINYVNNNLEIIKSEINAIAGKRSDLIDEIFVLHQEGRYIACVPLALAQIDGICKDYYGIGFFASEPLDKENKKSKMVQKLNKTLDDYSFSALLSKQLKFDNKNKLQLIKARNKNFDQLNRHNIMHGESYEYGTEINSVKAILLLDFLRDLIETVEGVN